MDNILEVKGLKISFRTNSGTVKAVRDISFDLERGKTLAIVGESGSGKSVTSKAILGILAGNSIIEGGEILYDGRDLLKIDEEEMHTIRGDKISMIFQDPLSSLNPIVKIGKQITEAMLLKNRSNRTHAKADFNGVLSELQKACDTYCPDDSAHLKELIAQFKTACRESSQREKKYNESFDAAQCLKRNLDGFLFKAGKNVKQDTKHYLPEFKSNAADMKDAEFLGDRAAEVAAACEELKSAVAAYRPAAKSAAEETLPTALTDALGHINALVKELCAQPKPDFYASSAALSEEMQGIAEKLLKASFDASLEGKKNLTGVLREAEEYYAGDYTKAEALQRAKALYPQVKATIDPLEIHKDSRARSFEGSLNTAIEKYFHYEIQNGKERQRYAKQSQKREALISKGKQVDWKVVPMNIVDLAELKGDISLACSLLRERYEAAVRDAGSVDHAARAAELMSWLKKKAYDSIYVVTRSDARDTAIRLMEEVGISEPRMRFTQYPFEFSGGMRQRIVIAIALAADPEILICDEPTTALDVTIQAQILDLINHLKEERNLSIIFITHDLGVVANMADDIAVMYAGKIVEYGTADDIFYDPRHPYTWALLASMPDLDTKEKLESIPGTPPNMIYPPVGDAFAPRNKYAMQIDFEQQPPAFRVSDTHWAATWLLHPDAPKVEMPHIIADRIARMKAKEAENG